MVVLSSCYLAAFVGLILAPSGPAVVVLSVLIGIGTGAFPLALTLIALRSRTSLATTSLSAFTQCTGYLIASVGPVGFGILFDVSGGWTVPLLVLCGVVLVQAGAGVLAVRPRYVEDELPAACRWHAGSGSMLGVAGQARPSRAVARAARPSPRPVSPSPSVVVPATETGAPTTADSARLRFGAARGEPRGVGDDLDRRVDDRVPGGSQQTAGPR